MIRIVKTRRDLLLERIHKLESFVYSDQDDEVLKKIHKDHLQFLREELSKCEGCDEDV